jgi:small-conductance mechanosensitive channel/CRP-like cAMP-binding protein
MILSASDTFGILGDPIVQTGVLAAVGALVTRIGLRRHPTRRLVGQLVFFAALTGLLLYHDIVPYAAGPSTASSLERVFIALAKVIWWINAAWSLISVVRVFLIIEGQPREGRLVQDLVVGIIYIGALLSVVAYVFDAPVGTLIATSGIVAIILGLALQSTLSDVFSGIALNLGKPYSIGDWIVLDDGIQGRVVETNWRATHLLNGVNDLVVVPNSNLAKARLTNLSSPERSHGVTMAVRIVPTVRPAAMADLMRTALLSSNAILFAPEPTVQVKGLDSAAVELELSFCVADLSAAGKAQNEIFDLIYRHAKAAGLQLAAPRDSAVLFEGRPTADEAVSRHRATPLRLLDAIALFVSLTEDEKEALAATMTRRTFRKGEILAKQGETLTSLMIIRSGAAVITRNDGRRDLELARLAPSDWFGEGGLLTNAGEPGTVRALTFVVAYEISQQSLAPLMRDRPSIAEELGSILSRRDTAGGNHTEHSREPPVSNSVPGLVARIRRLFEIERLDIG